MLKADDGGGGGGWGCLLAWCWKGLRIFIDNIQANLDRKGDVRTIV